MGKSIFRYLIIALWFSQLAPLQAAVPEMTREKAQEFIKDFGKRALHALTKPGLDQTQRENNFQAFLEEGFDLKAIGSFLVGPRFWHAMSEGQQQQFISLLETQLKRSYANRFQDYGNVTFAVQNANKDKNHIIVHSTIQKGEQSAIPINWEITYSKVTDVKIESVSMSITLRDEYRALVTSITKKNKPPTADQVNQFLNALKNKINRGNTLPTG